MTKKPSDSRSKSMRANKATGSTIERKLALALWHRGIRYRKNDKSVYGRPDLTLKRFKVAIFADGDFWHGRNWNESKYHHKTNIKFWHNKIERNIERDNEVNEYLKKRGWTVLRFWESDINNNLDSCVQKIEETINVIDKQNS